LRRRQRTAQAAAMPVTALGTRRVRAPVRRLGSTLPGT
jgi:hypothetical protein